MLRRRVHVDACSRLTLARRGDRPVCDSGSHAESVAIAFTDADANANAYAYADSSAGLAAQRDAVTGSNAQLKAVSVSGSVGTNG